MIMPCEPGSQSLVVSQNLAPYRPHIASDLYHQSVPRSFSIRGLEGVDGKEHPPCPKSFLARRWPPA